MGKFKIKCVQGENEFVLMIKATDDIQAVQLAYEKYNVDHAELCNDKFVNIFKRENGSYYGLYKRATRGRRGQVIFG